MAKTKRDKAKRQSSADFMIASGNDVPFNYVESFKSLRTNLNFIAATEKLNTFILTSAIPGEGKSNTAINLAITLAEDSKSVVVVDCDLRKPSLNRYLKLGRNFKGVTDILTGNATVEDALIQFEDLGIHVLTAGAVPPNPSEMLSAEPMQKLVEDLKAAFDYVILDTPPVSVVTDAAILGRYADGALLCVRSDFAPKETVQLAKERLTAVGVRILGVVLTGFDAKNDHKSSAYSYTYEYEYKSKNKSDK
ncbi:MAG: CpsD/CapB family tyrosine-protein kinase [Clostridia bacterium]|jgi:capsular exopolysaccharide family|nr:CpsD/CapB family tyrosine-protein kinase [Clostridia bacterium]MBQ2437734.1 CpsD/CapB family tyrosine-protein kinase [Clostridia bacterium]MBQ2567587.1 CpsD/CapB family tyrosine-protein kinase [Clostridia bacterium]MBQ3051480.1 CpsD/CapB family tyrosine-protein kinase [Clostridia bacterium]MBQ3328206.1 CpsD/CapB family tyrosine-protein kinase [Clostridia bacterium]